MDQILGEIDTPIEHLLEVNGTTLKCYEWGVQFRDVAPTIMLAHATGFGGMGWMPVVRRLPRRHIISFDQRGHGGSSRCEDKDEAELLSSWRIFGDDLAELVKVLDLDELIGVGHSMGAYATIVAASELKDRYKRLVAIDPTIFPDNTYFVPEHPVTAEEIGQHFAGKRRNHFSSVQALVERFIDRLPFSGFHPEAFTAYCEHALVPSPDGDGYVLACDPSFEANVYTVERFDTGILKIVRSLDVPVLILRGREPPPERSPTDFISSPTWPQLVDQFPNAREIYLPKQTHFIAQEIPDQIAQWILETD
jgi:lipase